MMRKQMCGTRGHKPSFSLLLTQVWGGAGEEQSRKAS